VRRPAARLLAPVGPAFADPPELGGGATLVVSDHEPNRRAICMGQEAASISPPGSSAELPGGVPELRAFVSSLPGTLGATTRVIAQVHAGSHAACDGALE
jgi:hypothetical protein